MSIPTLRPSFGQSGGTGSLSMATPASLSAAVGDIAVVCVESAGDQPAQAITGLGSTVINQAFSIADLQANYGSRLTMFWYRIDASNLNVSPSVSDTGDHQIACIAIVTGEHDLDASVIGGVASGAVTTEASSITTGSIVTADAECLLLIFASRPNDSLSTTHFELTSGSATEYLERGSASGNGGGFVMLQANAVTAGSYGPWTLSKAASTTGAWAVVAVRGQPYMTASASAQAGGSATLFKGVSLEAVALGVATSGASISQTVPLAAAALVASSSAGQLYMTVTLGAAALAQAQAVANAVAGKPLASTGAAQAAGSADLSVGNAPVNLAASAQASGAASATLSLVVNLSAQAVAQAQATSQTAVAKALAAQAIAQAQGSAALALGKPLAAQAQAQASSGTTLVLQVPLDAAALAQAQATGQLLLNVSLSADSLAQTDSQAVLVADVHLRAGATATTAATANLVTVRVLGAGSRVLRSAADMSRSHAAVDLGRLWAANDSQRNWSAHDMEVTA